jgi:cysteine sulfinate desulfinase/cysteine desulfurase-like protein
MNRTLWERPLERLTAVGLAAVTFHAGRAGARIMGGTEWLSQAVGMGAAAQLIAREVHANKAAVAAVREPLKHVTEALAPLVHHPDQRVATAAEELLAATSAILDHAQVEAALAAFGEAVRAAIQPVPSRWSRLRRRAPQST